MADHAADRSTGSLTLSEGAVRRIAALRVQEGNDGLMLRVSVSGGGCSGFQYGFTLDDRTTDEDVVFRRGDVALVIDDVSLGLLDGSEIDFVEDLVGSYFAVKNPNAASTCGCGSSFAI